MKRAILFLLCSVYSTFLFSQKDYISKQEITRIEVGMSRGGPFIKLLQEGLLCETFTEIGGGKQYHISTFIPLHRIDTKKLNKLQWFIKKDSLFHHNSVFQDVELSTSIDEHSWIDVLIIHPDYSSNHILWDTGKAKKLVKCIELLNDLMPLNDRRVFAIDPKYIRSREGIE